MTAPSGNRRPATASSADAARRHPCSRVRCRPAVLVSNDAANATAGRLGRGVITVVPVTSNVERVYPFQVLLRAAQTGLNRDSKAQAEQIRSIAVERVGDRLGVVPHAIMLDIDEAPRLHLGL